LKVYIINSITKSYILNIKIRPLVTKYALTIKLVDGTSSAHSFNPYAYFGHSWSYFDIQNLRLVILYIVHQTWVGIWCSLSELYIYWQFLSDLGKPNQNRIYLWCFYQTRVHLGCFFFIQSWIHLCCFIRLGYTHMMFFLYQTWVHLWCYLSELGRHLICISEDL